MSIKIKSDYQKEIFLNVPLQEAYDYFSDVEKSVPENFSILKSFTKISENLYCWEFKPLEYMGYSLKLKIETSFECSPFQITAKKAGTSEHDLELSWVFLEKESKTQLQFKAELIASVNLPFFMSHLITPLAEKEVIKFFDSYIKNVENKFK
jgi:carbon monoxide dehydrogenase subunit G